MFISPQIGNKFLLKKIFSMPIINIGSRHMEVEAKDTEVRNA
ncbi:MAG TPA: hypothetical protein PLA12_12365 [Candidatus Hydrogenedens sp.]|nr:hypothetical protein [Candidatus Hydrogenedens sp.]